MLDAVKPNHKHDVRY